MAEEDRTTKLEVVVAQLVTKLDAMSESMKLNIDRLIEKMEHGDREGATLFKLIEQRLNQQQQVLEPLIRALEKELRDFVHEHEKVSHPEIDKRVTALEKARAAMPISVISAIASAAAVFIATVMNR